MIFFFRIKTGILPKVSFSQLPAASKVSPVSSRDTTPGEELFIIKNNDQMILHRLKELEKWYSLLSSSSEIGI